MGRKHDSGHTLRMHGGLRNSCVDSADRGMQRRAHFGRGGGDMRGHVGWRDVEIF